jgi:hypothetical protein
LWNHDVLQQTGVVTEIICKALEAFYQNQY